MASQPAVAIELARQLIPMRPPPLIPISDSYPRSLKSFEDAMRIDSGLLALILYIVNALIVYVILV